MNRRSLMKGALVSGSALVVKLCGGNRAQAARRDPFSDGTRLGTVAFAEEGSVALDLLQGAELDGRLYTDLSGLESSRQIISADKFYVRTRASTLLPSADDWRVKLGGHVERPAVLGIESLRKRARAMGVHVMECAGNVRLTRFGLISVGRWTGVPISEVLEEVQSKSNATRVLISGFDRYSAESKTSVPGASWIFTVEQLKAAGAFLATELNEQSLGKDHGAPVRLVVPGWYGCTCIKWVEEIRFVDESTTATSQMQEYAARTLQNGVPRLAKDYEPAVIEPAAMPIRIEKWNVAGKVKYRVVGIAWGGTHPLKSLQIRFNPEEDYATVDDFHQENNDPWTVWTHAWSPKSAGTYLIRLAIEDRAVQARKLNSGYYVRTVEITEL